MRRQPKAKVARNQYWQSMTQVGFVLALVAFILLLVSFNINEFWLPLFCVGLLLFVALGWLRPHEPIVIGINVGAIVAALAVSYLVVIPSKESAPNTGIDFAWLYYLMSYLIGCPLGGFWGAALGVIVSGSRARRKAAIWGLLAGLFVGFIWTLFFGVFIHMDYSLSPLLGFCLFTGPAGVIVGATFIEARDAWRKVQPIQS